MGPEPENILNSGLFQHPKFNQMECFLAPPYSNFGSEEFVF